MKKFLMGNEAIALGAINAGVNLVTGYPGTPSTEILESVAKNNDGSIYVEWSVNEKVALEVAAGASYSGARTLVTMKQVGLNVASDPLMSLAYIGVKGGMVIVSADDPGPISSQTEQDTRHFARFAKIPVFDPCSPEEAYAMVKDAFALSEEYSTPVLLRPTTRVCHSCACVEVDEEIYVNTPEGFEKDSRWVIFPKLSYENHLKIEERNPLLGERLSSYRFNTISGSGKKGIATGGISYACTKEALGDYDDVRLLKIGTSHPFPEKLALEFLQSVNQVLVIEELDPVIERELIYICGKYGLDVEIRGKISGDVKRAGENSTDYVKELLEGYLGIKADKAEVELPSLPVRPPVLCAGCPHRASFYAVKQAMKGQKAFYAGDIGCYTLGNAAPLNMVDTCLCMGADVTIAQGLQRTNPDAKHFAFIGDSTFFASGITGVINAVYNESDITLIVLDNSTTAMTGQQPHPGTGKTVMGDITQKISIPKVLEAIGVKKVFVEDPMNLERAAAVVKEAADIKGVTAVVFESPCIAVCAPSPAFYVDEEKCTGCKMCISRLGCPAITMEGKKAYIDSGLCYGCSICAQVCPFYAIKEGDAK